MRSIKISPTKMIIWKSDLCAGVRLCADAGFPLRSVLWIAILPLAGVRLAGMRWEIAAAPRFSGAMAERVGYELPSARSESGGHSSKRSFATDA